MEKISLGSDDEDFKDDLEETKTICRCCLSTERFMYNACNFEALFNDLAGISVLQSDGLPQWLCYECRSLLRKAVRFKHKVLRAHTVLHEYLTRCAPFPIDAQDEELSKYASPHLAATETLHLDTTGKGRSGVYKVLQHEKKVQTSELDDVAIPMLDNEENVKEEMGFSDYEDNITLEEFRLEANKITEDDLASILQETDQVEVKKEKGVKKKKKAKRKQEKKMKESEDENEPKPKSSIRKTVELDPNKIRIVTLNPEEQIKQREEESKAGLRFPHQCHLCYKGFNFESKLQNHMAKHSPSRGPYECKLCSMYLPTNYSFTVHSLIHTRRYECVECNRRMMDRSSILDHYKSQHEGLVTIYTCQICGKVSNNNKTHRGHMRNHHGGDRPKCDQCGKTFINNDSLKEHQQIHLGIKNYECDTCGMKFRTRTQMKHHHLKHSDVQDYYCVECDVRFKSSHSLRQHLTKSLKHRDKTTLLFPCPRCPARFATAPALARHVRVQHEGERAHPCGACGAALASRASLAKHAAALHAGRRPPHAHVCDTCGKAFRAKSVLTNHVRTHTGEKPFECAECGRKFSQRTAMRTHVKLVHLKIKKNAKIKPEAPLAESPKELFKPDVNILEAWRTPCDVYFQVTAGP